MGNMYSTMYCIARALKNKTPAPDEDNDEGWYPGIPIHMLVCAIDYKGTSAELTCTADGNNIVALAQACGVSDITYITDNQCTKEGVLSAIAQVGSQTQDGEYFVFFYAGHGANLPDDNGDEPDGQDEALCTVTATGDLDFDAFVRDDEFAAAVTSSVPQGAKILIMCDCCHSGTIGDFSNPCWSGFSAVSMSGCKDSQTAGDTGRGGIWTHSMCIAVSELQSAGKDLYSCAQLYNMQLEKDDQYFSSPQDIEMYWTDALNGAEDLAWPFIPLGPYSAPWLAMTPQQRALR